MAENQTPKYEVCFIQKLLSNLISEDKMHEKHKKQPKGDYLTNGVKACKKLNKQLNRPTFDR